MSLQVTGRLELNLLNAKTKPDYASQFAIKHRIPTIVASPEYIAPLAAHRAVMGGRYQLICTLDFPKGVNFAMDKLLRTNPDFVVSDGFDILLSTGRSGVEFRNEIKTIHEFLKINSPATDIRWCLRMNTKPEEAPGILKGMDRWPPTFIRTDQHLASSGTSIEDHKKNIKLIREHVPFPLKVSGNVTLEVFEALKDLPGVKRFDVSMEQAESLVRAIKAEGAPVPKPQADRGPKLGPAVKRVGTAGRIRIP